VRLTRRSRRTSSLLTRLRGSGRKVETTMFRGVGKRENANTFTPSSASLRSYRLMA
jgi:hypothetical protein